ERQKGYWLASAGNSGLIVLIPTQKCSGCTEACYASNALRTFADFFTLALADNARVAGPNHTAVTMSALRSCFSAVAGAGGRTSMREHSDMGIFRSRTVALVVLVGALVPAVPAVADDGVGPGAYRPYYPGIWPGLYAGVNAGWGWSGDASGVIGG